MAEATEFARQGLAVLIYEKRSVGYTKFLRSAACRRTPNSRTTPLAPLARSVLSPASTPRRSAQRRRGGRTAGGVCLRRRGLRDRGERQRDAPYSSIPGAGTGGSRRLPDPDAEIGAESDRIDRPACWARDVIARPAPRRALSGLLPVPGATRHPVEELEGCWCPAPDGG